MVKTGLGDPVAALRGSGAKYPTRYSSSKNCEDAMRTFFKKHGSELLSAARVELRERTSRRGAVNPPWDLFPASLKDFAFLTEDYSRAAAWMKALTAPPDFMRQLREQHEAITRVARAIQFPDLKFSREMLNISDLHAQIASIAYASQRFGWGR